MADTRRDEITAEELLAASRRLGERMDRELFNAQANRYDSAAYTGANTWTTHDALTLEDLAAAFAHFGKRHTYRTRPPRYYYQAPPPPPPPTSSPKLRIEAAEVLGLSQGFWSPADLKAAYRRRVRETHPDVGGDPEEFKRVQAAWELLSS